VRMSSLTTAGARWFPVTPGRRRGRGTGPCRRRRRWSRR
jgi:hypothetical protein